ncbi:hypothetical protein ACFPES_27560 [Paenibacillus sp. GCM10023248]|uniref:hypothetical protein n=1 Tax=Bacillales TaxID=1385 RepID=UPI0023785C8C|nr:MULTISPECIES: hypothetical protein [Bacillales]MDD9270821.1 hypothetical protein [Paenibacillus sp. MAHUQ-63]MDR6883268.1 hypothetical protein [Bacillus sp. 3255]
MKVLTWLGKIIISSVLITSITMFTTWYVVNMYVEDIFRQYQIPALGKKIQFGEFAARLADDLNIVMRRDGGKQAAPAESPAPTQPAPSPSPSGSVPSSGTADRVSPETESGSGASRGAEDDAVAVMGRVSSEANEQDKQIVMSTEDFAKKKEALSSDDKMKIFSLVVAKLPQDEVQHLSVLLENGITNDELKQVNDTLKKYLNETEYKQLTDILNKYS